LFNLPGSSLRLLPFFIFPLAHRTISTYYYPVNGKRAVYSIARATISGYLITARQKEHGIISKDNPDFLHDYRVSLRKARSLMNLMEGVFSAEVRSLVRKSLGSLMKKTNHVRDLDVCLSENTILQEPAPEGLEDMKAELIRILESDRRQYQDQVRQYLRSYEYKAVMKDVGRALGIFSRLSKGPLASMPVVPFAGERVIVQYETVVSTAKALDSDSPWTAVHKLRIECKRLRYLIDSFLPLYPGPESPAMLTTLKGLQDAVGRFTDYSVQIEYFEALKSGHIETAEYADFIIGRLFSLRVQTKLVADAMIADFISAHTEQSFISVFS